MTGRATQPPNYSSVQDAKLATASEDDRVQLGVWDLAWPTVLTHLLQSLVGFVDILVVGRLGAEAVAAATTGLRLFFVLQTVVAAIHVGTTALVARAIGAANPDEAARVLSRSLQLAWLVTSVTAALGVGFAGSLATWSGLQGEAHALALQYIQVVSLFAPCFATMAVVCSALRAAGEARAPFAIGAFSNLANVCFLYLWVQGGLGAPKLGVAGAALSGGLSFGLGALLAYGGWRANKFAIPWVRSDWQQLGHGFRSLLRIGSPAAAEQILMQSAFVVFTAIIAGFYGTNAVAAYGIGTQMLSLSIVVGSGFSIAAAALVGQHLGARAPRLAIRSGWRALRLAVASMTAMALVVTLCAKPIVRAMISDPAVESLAVDLAYVLCAAQPMLAIEFALVGALHGAGDTRYPLVATLAGLIVGRVCLAALFTWLGLPIVWTYATVLVESAIKAGLMIARFRSNHWQSALTYQI